MIKIKFTGRNYNDLLDLPCVLAVSKILDGEVQPQPHAVVRHIDGSMLLLEQGDTILLNSTSDKGCQILKNK